MKNIFNIFNLPHKEKVSNRIKILFLFISLFLYSCYPNESIDFSEDSDSSDGTNIAQYNPSKNLVPSANDNFLDTSNGTGLLAAIPSGLTSNYFLSNTYSSIAAIDGWSTTAPILTTFDVAVNPSTIIGGTTVKVFNGTNYITTYINSVNTGSSAEDAHTAASAAIGADAELTAGTHYNAKLSSDGKTLYIKPIQPLDEKQTYVIVLTKGIISTSGNAIGPSNSYTSFKSSVALEDESLEKIRKNTNMYESFINTVDNTQSKDDIVLSWSVTTQSIGKVLEKIETNLDTATIDNVTLVGQNGTAAAIAAAMGTTLTGEFYFGTIKMPYYLDAPSGHIDINGDGNNDANSNTDTIILSNYWKPPTGILANGLYTNGALSGSTPISNGLVTVPVLAYVPASAINGSTLPVTIFQHGITRNRSDMIGVAESLSTISSLVGVGNDRMVIAIDMPLHGILSTDPTASFIDPLGTNQNNERHFEVDINGDGKADNSGEYIINTSNLLASRDNLRQAVADLFYLTRTIQDGLTITNGTTGHSYTASTTDINFIGISLGGIVGASFVALEDAIGHAVLNVTGGGIASLLDGSPFYSTKITSQIHTSSSLVQGSARYNNYISLVQQALDTVDPINFTATGGISGTNYINSNTLNADRIVLMQNVVGDSDSSNTENPPDQIVPNYVCSGYENKPVNAMAAYLSGADPLATMLGATKITNPHAVAAGNAYITNFNNGTHGSLLASNDVAGYVISNGDAVTTAMQSQYLALFGAGVVQVADSTVYDSTYDHTSYKNNCN